MNDKQTFMLMRTLTNVFSEDGREVILLVSGFGQAGGSTNVFASLSKDGKIEDLIEKFIMLLQSTSSVAKVDIAELLEGINAAAEKRGFTKKEG